MESSFSDQIRPLLLSLSTEIRQLIATISPDDIALTTDMYFQYKWDDFQYTKKGVQVTSGTGSYSSQPVWNKALGQILMKIYKSEAYNEVVQLLNPRKSLSFNPELSVQTIVTRLAAAHFPIKVGNQQSDPDELITRFINQLITGQANAHIKIKLTGITLESPFIQISPTIKIRQTALSDLEALTPVFPPRGIDDPFPSAIIEIDEIISKGQGSKIMDDVSKIVAILRLYGVGSIEKLSHSVSSDAIVNDIGSSSIMGSNLRIVGHDVYYITKSEEPTFVRFFKFLYTSIPDIYRHNRPVTILSVAFDRYVDALMEYKIYERKVMNTVMGLEALYTDDKMELAYKLAVRTSKAMSLIGMDPLNARNLVKAGYSIRSTFAHGAHLKKKELSKFDEQFDGHANIALRLCDILRRTLCIYILSEIEKPQLISSLDDSLLSEHSAAILTEKFQQYIDLLA